MMNEEERKEFLKTAYDVPIEYPVTFVKSYCRHCRGNSEFIIPHECHCHVDQGCGYTFQDEYGDCDYCNSEMRCTVCNCSKECEI